MPSLLPDATPLRIVTAGSDKLAARLASLDVLLLFVNAAGARQSLDKLPHAAALRAQFARATRSAGAHFAVALPTKRPTLAVVGLLPAETGNTFGVLSLAGEMMRVAMTTEPATIGVAVAGLDGDEAQAALEAGIAAAAATTFAAPRFSRQSKRRNGPGRIIAFGGRAASLRRLRATLEGTDLVRWLTLLPPDRLDPAGFRRAAVTLARKAGLSVRFYDEAALRRLGAGAFLAVTQGSPRRDAGILRISYRPARGTRAAPVALVGKGICFDTGGNNLKPHKAMLDMHTDMAGSAVALATVLALAGLGFGRRVDAWLALAENHVGPRSYKPQDVVSAMNGTTIQVIHTDAEGRMVLADTLALASRAKPAAIIDLATLTGACVTALTERYSGAFTNRPAWRESIERAGRNSGERVWCLPMDEDFDRELDSKVADVIQCPVEGKGDHIYAARFLSRFVGAHIPWLHIDLAAATRSGGLAHVSTDATGFGVRFLLSLLLDEALPAGTA